MNKTSIALISAISLGVASCANGSGVNVAPSVTAFVNGVVADVVAACQVEPVFTDIAALFPIYGAAVGAAANAVCAAVKKAVPATSMAQLSVMSSSIGPPVREGVPPVVVHGVTIHFK